MSDQISTTFWTIFRSVLRVEKTNEAEEKRSLEACVWLVGELATLRRYCSANESALLSLIYEHWAAHHIAPSYTILKVGLAQASKPELEEHLKDFDALRASLPRLHAADLPALLQTKIKEWARDRLETTLKNALVINVAGADVPIPGGKRGDTRHLEGPDDALTFIVEKMETGSFGSTPGLTTHGWMDQDVLSIKDRYEQREDPNYTALGRIFVGLRELDSKTRMRKGQFIGILGAPASGKTRFGRSMVYNAVLNGARVLHISLEQMYAEEQERYATFLSHHPCWGTTLGVDGKPRSRGIVYENILDNKLTAEEKSFFFDTVLPEWVGGSKGIVKGQLMVYQASAAMTWEAIKTTIRMYDQQRPLDMVFMDYFSMISPRGHETRNDAVQGAANDAKTFAQTFRGGEGLLFITPVQANREGWRAAKKNGGLYNLDGVDTFSCLTMAMDTVLSVFSDDELEKEAAIILGTTKFRRGGRVLPHKVGVIHACGLFQDLAPQVVSEEVGMDVMEDL